MFFATEDDRWIFLHRRAAHHAARQERVLGCGHSDAEVAEAVRRWKGADLEEAVVAADACAALVRTHDEWARLEQAAAVAGLPLLEVTKIGDSDPEPAGAGDRPLGGLRVLDVTHVLAGPTCARTLAEHGADVLRIGMSSSGDGNPMQRDTGHGKRSAVLDLKSADGASVLRTLTGGADVFSQGYRPGALAALGFSPEDAARLRPGIVYVSMTAFGRLGPWRGRRGYDSVVQSASGFCDEVAADGEPRFLPVSALDYVTGYLAAFGVLTALERRAAEGGSYHVQLSLAQTGRYLAGLPRTSAAERAGRSPSCPPAGSPSCWRRPTRRSGGCATWRRPRACQPRRRAGTGRPYRWTTTRRVGSDAMGPWFFKMAASGLRGSRGPPGLRRSWCLRRWAR